MRKLAKAYNTAVLTVTAAALLFVGAFTVPRLFGVYPFVVQSSSMEPAIPTGSVVFVNTKDSDMEAGDVVTFGLSAGEGKGKGVYVTHRIYRIFEEEDLIQTKGDANNAPDGYLEKGAVLGKAFLRVPRIGFLLDYLQKRHGYIILAVLVCGLNVSSMFILKASKGQHSGDARKKNKK